MGDLGKFKECKQGFIHDTEQGLCCAYRRNTSVEAFLINFCLIQLLKCTLVNNVNILKVLSRAGFACQYSAQLEGGFFSLVAVSETVKLMASMMIKPCMSELDIRDAKSG